MLNISQEVWFDYAHVTASGPTPPEYAYIISGCNALHRSACSRTRDTCGGCLAGYASSNDADSNSACVACATVQRTARLLPHAQI